MKQRGRTLFWLLPLLGTAFALWYVKNATCDVVYSDYIRLVNSYLPDVWNPEKFFVPDVLTRIPINYLARIINVELFGFSVTFERVLGVLSLGLAGGVFALYCRRVKIGVLYFALLTAVMFSLNKWEMLTNGSGWSHFFAFACFYYHELVLDRVWAGQEKWWDRLRLCVLPWLIILGTAGPYCAIYAVTLLISYAFCMVRAYYREGRARWDLRWAVYGACTLIPLLLYMVSNSFAVEEHAGATGRSLMTVLADKPDFPVRFLLKSFAGIAVGGEELSGWLDRGLITNKACYLLGLFVILGYLGALWLNVKHRLYERTIMPLMLLAGGGMNHLLIFVSRYIFEQENYAMSSRYALQFQVGILGILITFALAWHRDGRFKAARQALTALFCLAILAGNGYTTYREIQKAPYREDSFEEMVRQVPNIHELSDQELQRIYEYKKGRHKIEQAFQILEDNHLNVFYGR